jgi:hypothetical protein
MNDARSSTQVPRPRPSGIRLMALTAGLGLLPISLASLAGCHGKSAAAAPDDATLTHNIQYKIATDSAISSEPIHASVQNAVATLDGSVSTEALRSLASSDVSQVSGIRTVVNNLTVQPAANAAMISPPSLPPEESKTDRHKPSALVPEGAPQAAPSGVSQETPQQAQQEAAPLSPPQPPPPPAQATLQAQAAPAPIVRSAPPATVAPPPAHIAHVIVIPADTIIPIRIDEALDSATAKIGDTFSGVIASDVILDNITVLPQGTPVDGRVSAAQDATHFSGNSLLTVELTHLDRRGEQDPVATDGFTKTGAGRGKDTAKKAGAGAVIGAVIGGIFGGGKGALIGAATGGGTSAATNAISRGQQVQIPAETLIRFHLTAPVRLQVSSSASEQHENSDLPHHAN